MKTIVLTHAAAKQLDGLPSAAQGQVGDALGAYATMGRGDVKALVNRPGFRLRGGRYRVLFMESETIYRCLCGKARDNHLRLGTAYETPNDRHARGD